MELSGFNMPPLPTTLRDFIPLMIASLWPFTILFLVLWFQKEIKTRIKSMTRAQFLNNVFEFDPNGIDDRERNILTSVEVKQTSTPSTAKWENVADLFWLGNDLEWTVQTLLRGAPKERIFHGLRQCDHHSSQLGLADSAPGKQVAELKSQVDSLPEAALDRQWRNDFVEKMYLVIKGFHSLVRQSQPNFRPGPER